MSDFDQTGCGPSGSIPGSARRRSPTAATATSSSRADRLSVALDLPTQRGYDSDDPEVAEEVGRVDVAIDTLADTEILFQDIPLDKVSTGFTINGTAAILLAFYIAAAERKGVPRKKLTGTVQNDILNEYASRGTWICEAASPQGASRVRSDTPASPGRSARRARDGGMLPPGRQPRPHRRLHPGVRSPARAGGLRSLAAGPVIGDDGTMGEKSASQAPAIVVEGLRKDYGEVRAVDGVSFQVERGEIYALLGPNGAGKTTTVEILEGHRRRSGGSVRVLGFDPDAGDRHFRERVGIVLQSGGMDAELTVRETVALFAGFYARPRDVAETIEQVGLDGKRRSRVRTLSAGQVRRLDLALALIGDPEVLFLDEPTTGFDPNARRDAWDMIAGLRRSGTTVLLTSHYLDEVQQLADRVGVMSHGQLVEESTPDALGGRDVSGTLISFRLPEQLRGSEPPAGPWDRAAGPAGEFTMHTDEPTKVLLALTQWACAHQAELPGLTVTRPSLEDVYLRITGQAGIGAGDGH